MIGEWLGNTLSIALEAAPWLVLGLLAAGLIRAWLPAARLAPHLGGRGWKPVTRAAVLGAPLPLCSCAVLPAAFTLRRQGASRGATASFLVSTPETGVDSVALSWVLLGPFLAIARPVAALISAVATGLIVDRSERATAAPDVATATGVDTHHCSHGDTCRYVHDVGSGVGGRWARTMAGVRYAFTDMMDDLAPWLAAGIVLAGAVVTLVPPALLAEWGSGPVAMALILVLAVPMYVCATATTPLAHAMLHAGVSPGTVLVFLLAGPATNIGGMMLIRRELGRRTLTAYLTGVCGSAFVLGLALDLTWGWVGWNILAGHVHDHDHSHLIPLPGWITAASLLLLVLCALRRTVPARRPREAVGSVGQ